jgi:hypothetical protein
MDGSRYLSEWLIIRHRRSDNTWMNGQIVLLEGLSTPGTRKPGLCICLRLTQVSLESFVSPKDLENKVAGIGVVVISVHVSLLQLEVVC